MGRYLNLVFTINLMKSLEEVLLSIRTDKDEPINLGSFEYRFSNGLTITGDDLIKARELYKEVRELYKKSEFKEDEEEDYIAECQGRAELAELASSDNPLSKYKGDTTLSIYLRDLLITASRLRVLGTGTNKDITGFCSSKEDLEIHKLIIEKIPEIKKHGIDMYYGIYIYVDGALGINVSKEEWLKNCEAFLSSKENRLRLIRGIDSGDTSGIFSEILQGKKYQENEKIDMPKTLDSLLKTEGDIKRRIYDNDKETINHMQSLGVDFDWFVNLTDQMTVRRSIERLLENKELAERPGYKHIANNVRSRFNLSVEDLDEETIKIYSDEVALIFEEAFEKDDKLKQRLQFLDDHIQQSFYDGKVSFRLASRDKEDLKLGDKCGDCTAKDGVNNHWIKAWIADVNTQFLKLYYEKSFIGRKNLVLAESENRPMLLIDAIEFIPQAREHEEYDARARTAFEAGLRKVKDIAHRINVENVFAYSFSNSSDVEDLIESMGYHQERVNFRLVRRKPLHKVLDVNEEINYNLQTREESEDLTQQQLRNFEIFMNRVYLADNERKDRFNKLAEKDEVFKATSEICAELEEHMRDLEYDIFPPSQDDVSYALDFLYGKDKGNGRQGILLYRIVS